MSIMIWKSIFLNKQFHVLSNSIQTYSMGSWRCVRISQDNGLVLNRGQVIIQDNYSLVLARDRWIYTWWRHQMEIFSTLLAFGVGNSQGTGEFPAQRPVTRSFDVSFDLRLNTRLCKQSWGWWLRRHRAHYDVTVMTWVNLTTHTNDHDIVSSSDQYWKSYKSR